MQAVIQFLFADCVKPADIVHRMQVQYGESCLLRSMFYKCKDRFKQGGT